MLIVTRPHTYTQPHVYTYICTLCDARVCNPCVVRVSGLTSITGRAVKELFFFFFYLSRSEHPAFRIAA